VNIVLTAPFLQYQASVEKTFKQKQLNETYVAKAKERYEQDCHRVNAYTAQQSLVQGRDLEKVTTKLERAQSTVETNKRDYQNFTRALADTVARWDSEWKAFCDQSQDLEEERLEFMKDNIWAYANAVSTVCVNEDEVRVVAFLLVNLLTSHI
jgi:prophage DNA circulation protein